MSSLHELLFLCVHVPQFAAQARLRHRPSWRNEPVVVLDGVPPLQTVCSTTRKARQMGISHGTTRAELDSYSGVKALERSQHEELAAAAALLSAMWNVSPRAQVLGMRAGAHRLVLDITGTELIFGRPAQLAQTIRVKVQALGLQAQLAVSSNLHACVCAAPYAGLEPCMIERGQERAVLAPLPILALESLTEEQRETFATWGLHTLGEVAALPEEELITRMGQAGKDLRLLALGKHPHLLQPEQESFVLEERVEFDIPVELLDSLLFVLGPMLEQLVLRASSRSMALASVTVRLRLTTYAAEDTAEAKVMNDYARTVQPALPLADSRVLLKLLHLDLQAHPPGAPVTAIRLTAESGACTRAQLGLFHPQLPEPSRLDMTLARIRALVGEGRVGSPRLLDTHRPESFVVVQFDATQVPPDNTRAKTVPEDRACFAKQSTQALRRLRPPVLLRMRTSAKQPKLFFWKGTRYQVTEAFGPWSYSGSWWSPEAWSCEEWDVIAAADDGATLQCRIARDLLHQHWRLEGLYD